MYDVVVVGGNLAGATAAINAAHKDVKVAIIEKNKKPFSPAHCGEAIPKAVADYFKLDKIGCKYNNIKKVTVIDNYFSAYHHRNGGGDSITTDGALPIIKL